MFTNNWHKAWVASWSGVRGPTFIGTDNKLYAITPSPSIRFSYSNGSINGSGGVAFGTGSTPPTINDYYLSGSNITTLSVGSATSAKYDDQKHEFSCIYTITNTGDSDVTISEVAMFNSWGTSAVTGYNTACGFMIDRTVLDAPVTIPAGGIGQVTYTIQVNIPEA